MIKFIRISSTWALSIITIIFTFAPETIFSQQCFFYRQRRKNGGRPHSKHRLHGVHEAHAPDFDEIVQCGLPGYLTPVPYP